MIASGRSRFRFFSKTLIFVGGQWPPIPNFLCDPARWPQSEAEHKISAFYLNFFNQMQPVQNLVSLSVEVPPPLSDLYIF